MRASRAATAPGVVPRPAARVAVSLPSTSCARRISRSVCGSRPKATLTTAASALRTASSSGCSSVVVRLGEQVRDLPGPLLTLETVTR